LRSGKSTSISIHEHILNTHPFAHSNLFVFTIPLFPSKF